MDTGKDADRDYQSASEEAGEKGGPGCDQLGVKPIIGLLVVALIILCIRRFDKYTNYY